MDTADPNKNIALKRVLHRLAERVDIFQGMSPEEVGRLFVNAERLTVAAGDYIVKEGESGVHMYIIIEGNVVVTKQSQNGKSDIAIARLGAAQSFGEMVLIDNKPRSASVIAASPCSLFRISARNIDSTPDLGLKIYRNMARLISNRLREADQLLVWRI